MSLEHLANLLGRFQEAEATFFALDPSIRRHEFAMLFAKTPAGFGFRLLRNASGTRNLTRWVRLRLRVAHILELGVRPRLARNPACS